MDYYVEIMKDENDEVVKRMGPMSKCRAEKVEDGAGINLNWNAYSTRIVAVRSAIPDVKGA
jgi:hypothetical protein